MITNRITSFFLRQLTICYLESVLHHIFPPCNSPSELLNKFVDFFSNKIAKTRVDLDVAAPIHPVQNVNRVCPYAFDEFNTVIVDEVHKCVVKLSSKSRDLDPLPGYVT